MKLLNLSKQLKLFGCGRTMNSFEPKARVVKPLQDKVDAVEDKELETGE